MLKKSLILLALPLLAAGCASESGAGSAPELAGHTYGWSGGTTESCGQPPHISFGKDGSVAGLASCNRLLGQYRQKGDRIDLSGLGTTMMLCAPDTMKSERAFLGFLAKAKRVAAADGGAIELRDSSGAKIVTLVPVNPGKCD